MAMLMRDTETPAPIFARSLAGAASLLLVAACAGDPTPATDDDTGGSSDGPGINLTDTPGDDGDDVGDDQSSFDDDGDDSDSGPPVNQFKCTNVDFIFVVDNSSSMQDEQQFLAQGVPGFVSAMQNALPEVESFRVGVVDTDSYPALGTNGDALDGCPPDDPEVDCGTCDYQLGAFVSKPTSGSDPALSCEFSTGASYMDGKAETFANEFGCAALVGTTGNPVEQQAGALVAAVSSDLNGEGGCNDGFVRDDALLVFLLITDEEDNHASVPEPQGGSTGEPQEWFDALVAAKDGKDANVVALGLLGGSPKFADCADLSQGVDGAEQSSRLVDFVERFPTSFVGSVCSEGYGEFFQDALATVSEGCANFIP
jgi:hypothetical protein